MIIIGRRIFGICLARIDTYVCAVIRADIGKH